MNRDIKITIARITLSAAMLYVGAVFSPIKDNVYISLAWYLIAFLLVGLGVMREALHSAVSDRDFFTEFTLMTIASIGAFFIGEYPEGVAVMLLYCVGEMLQDKAVDRARDNIKSLIALRPDQVSVINNDILTKKNPADVSVSNIIEVRAGERVALDGVLISGDAAFDTAALTGESIPRVIAKNEEVLAGMIAADSVVRIKVSRALAQSSMSRILNMVEEAAERKSPTELFIRRFARIYTPIVLIFAVLVVFTPYIYSLTTNHFQYIFTEWLHRSLVFLVVSCPCALVISIPLGYFGGIGAASKRGILFKGSNYLDAITELNTVVFDKTGTLTTGELSVKEVIDLNKDDIKKVINIERMSNHPIAKAIVAIDGLTSGQIDKATTTHSQTNSFNSQCVNPSTCQLTVKDLPGYGLSADGWLIGTLRLLDKEGVNYPQELNSISETIVAVAENGIYKGHILLSDTLKADASETIKQLKNKGITHTEILSGDKQELVDKVANTLMMDAGYGNLLPQDKVAHISKLKSEGKKVAFIGDGINDAPVLALSDVGIAMGNMGTDIAIETADVVLLTDQPSKIVEAIDIGKRTRRIIKQNIAMAICIKIVVMVLGLLGIANLWEAVFADSGVALLAVLNATRVFITKRNVI